MDWRQAPPYARDGRGGDAGTSPSPFMVKHRASCACGAVAFEVRADPVDAKLCHCRQCQSLHGAPFQWAVIFHKADVRFVRGVDNLAFYSSELDRREHALPCKLSCATCGSPLADEGRNMFLAFGPAFGFSSPAQVPAAFEPTCHIFYGARVFDVNDGKPKYLGHKGSSPLWSEDGASRHRRRVPTQGAPRDGGPECSCVRLADWPLHSDFEITSLGDDGRGQVELHQCRSCERIWLRYLLEDEAFSHSGRWYRGLISAQAAAHATADSALAILANLEWHQYGGSYFDGFGLCEGPVVIA